MSHEVMITRGQRILLFFAYPGRTEPQKAGASWCWLVLDAEARFCLDMQKMIKSFVPWLSGPYGTSNFDCWSWICSDLNYTNTGCPTNILTTSDPILQCLKPHIKKGKIFFEKFVKKTLSDETLKLSKAKLEVFKLN